MVLDHHRNPSGASWGILARRAGLFHGAIQPENETRFVRKSLWRDMSTLHPPARMGGCRGGLGSLFRRPSGSRMIQSNLSEDRPPMNAGRNRTGNRRGGGTRPSRDGW